MRTLLHRTALIAALVAGSVVAAAPSAPAAPGTFTQITTPAADVVVQHVPPASATLTVAGIASPDVTSVDILCIWRQNTLQWTQLSGAHVPVSGGAFTTTVSVAFSPFGPCRLRAVPTGVDAANAYIGAFSGPVLKVLQIVAGTPATNFDVRAEPGDGLAHLDSAGVGIASLITVQGPGMVVGPQLAATALGLTSRNTAGTNSTVVVDGHPSYLPAQVDGFLRFERGLSVTRSISTFGFAPGPDGSITTTESSPLMRCAGSTGDTYPPTTGTCSSLVDAGVSFLRTASYGGDGHQILLNDTFVATAAGAHTVTAEYMSSVNPPANGTIGFHFPGSGPGFGAQSPGLPVPAALIGSGAGTMLVRSDLHAGVDDVDANTVGYTWSRPPSAVTFGSTTSQFGFGYTFGLPAGGSMSLGFAETEGHATADVVLHAAAAVAGFVHAPTITAPASGARIGTQTTTVTGTVSAGANGLPTSVTVNGRAATLTATGPSTATYSTRLTLGWGRHTITVTARDVAGNAATSAVAVTNTPALAEARGARERGTRLTVPVVCQSFSAGTCTGKLVVRSARGALLGKSAAFSVRRGRSASVPVTLRSAAHVVRVYLYQREPTGTYALASVKTVRV